MPESLPEPRAPHSEGDVAKVIPAKDAVKADAVLEHDGGGDEHGGRVHEMIGVLGKSRTRAREAERTSTRCGRGGLRGGPGVAAAEP